MAASQRGALLVERYGNLGLHSLHHFKYLSVFKRNNRCIYPMDFKMHRGGKGANPREHR